MLSSELNSHIWGDVQNQTENSEATTPRVIITLAPRLIDYFLGFLAGALGIIGISGCLGAEPFLGLQAIEFPLVWRIARDSNPNHTALEAGMLP